MHYTTEQLVEQAIAMIVKLTATPICPQELLDRVSKEYGEQIAKFAIEVGFDKDYIVFSPGTTVQLNDPKDAGGETEEASNAETGEINAEFTVADALSILTAILSPPKASTSASASNPFEELLDQIFGDAKAHFKTDTVVTGDKVRVKPGIPSEIPATSVGTVLDTFEDRALVLFANVDADHSGAAVAQFDQLVVIARA